MIHCMPMRYRAVFSFEPSHVQGTKTYFIIGFENLNISKALTFLRIRS